MRLGRCSGNGRDYLDICESRWFADVDWDAVYRKSTTPPFIPRVESEDDTRHFSREFLELPTELTPTTSFVERGGGGGGLYTDKYGTSLLSDDLFRGFSFTKNY